MSVCIKISNNNYNLNSGNEYYKYIDANSKSINDIYVNLTNELNSQFVLNTFYVSSSPFEKWEDATGKIFEKNEIIKNNITVFPYYKHSLIEYPENIILNNTQLLINDIVKQLIPNYKEENTTLRVKDSLNANSILDLSKFNSNLSSFLNEDKQKLNSSSIISEMQFHDTVDLSCFSNIVSKYGNMHDYHLKSNNYISYEIANNINKDIIGVIIPPKMSIAKYEKIVNYRFTPYPPTLLCKYNDTKFSVIKKIEPNELDASNSYALKLSDTTWPANLNNGWEFSGAFHLETKPSGNKEYHPIYNLNETIIITENLPNKLNYDVSYKGSEYPVPKGHRGNGTLETGMDDESRTVRIADLPGYKSGLNWKITSITIKMETQSGNHKNGYHLVKCGNTEYTLTSWQHDIKNAIFNFPLGVTEVTINSTCKVAKSAQMQFTSTLTSVTINNFKQYDDIDDKKVTKATFS